jgi:Kdo2-lipid IVA lauroyltransferase/acyltransferase
VQLLLKFLTRLPLPVLYELSRALFRGAFYVFRWRRPLAEANLRNAFPEKTESERAAILKQSYRNLADLIVETLYGYGASAADMQSRVRIENPELMKQCAEQGQSVVLLAAHFCNWEWLLLTAGAQLGIPIDAVYKPQKVVAFDRFLRDGRSRFGGNPIPADNFLFDVMKRKGEARAYALVADQTPQMKDEKHWSHFLNQDTAFFVGADKIARILNAPVLFVSMRRERKGFYSARLELLAAPPYLPDPDRDADHATGAEIIERYARALENEIRASPADWLWIERKWKYAKPLYA